MAKKSQRKHVKRKQTKKASSNKSSQKKLVQQSTALQRSDELASKKKAEAAYHTVDDVSGRVSQGGQANCCSGIPVAEAGSALVRTLFRDGVPDALLGHVRGLQEEPVDVLLQRLHSDVCQSVDNIRALGAARRDRTLMIEGRALDSMANDFAAILLEARRRRLEAEKTVRTI